MRQSDVRNVVVLCVEYEVDDIADIQLFFLYSGNFLIRVRRIVHVLLLTRRIIIHNTMEVIDRATVGSYYCLLPTTN